MGTFCCFLVFGCSFVAVDSKLITLAVLMGEPPYVKIVSAYVSTKKK